MISATAATFPRRRNASNDKTGNLKEKEFMPWGFAHSRSPGEFFKRSGWYHFDAETVQMMNCPLPRRWSLASLSPGLSSYAQPPHYSIPCRFGTDCSAGIRVEQQECGP